MRTEDPWECLLCPSVHLTVRSLGLHVIECHDDWVTGHRVPPLRVRELEEI